MTSNDDDFSESNAPGDIEDGLSFASSQIPGDEENTMSFNNIPSLLDSDNEAKNRSPTYADVVSSSSPFPSASASTATPIQSNQQEKNVFFDEADFDEDTDMDEKKKSQQRLSPVTEENPKLDDEIAKLEKELDLSSSKPQAYDLSGANKTYDLSAANYDLGSSTSKNDDQTSDTHLRSGASVFALHAWIKRKDWAAARQFFKSPPSDREKLINAIHYKNDDGETPLHIACRKKAPIDIVKALTRLGGKRTVLLCNTYGHSNALHHASHFNASADVIEHLIKVGGVDAVRKPDDIGNLPIHWALSKRAPNKVIKQLIEMGGFDTVTMPNRIGWTAMHTACYFDANTDIISYLVGISGPQSVRVLDKKYRTPIDLIIERNQYSFDSIITLLHALGDLDHVSLNLPQATINSILEWVRKQPCSTALECKAVQRILNETFVSRKYLTVWMIDFYFQLLLVLLFSFGIDSSLRDYGIPIDAGPTAGLYICISWFLGREVIQLITTPFNEFIKDLKNIVDVSQVILIFLSLDKLVFRDGVQSSSDVTIITLTAGVVWFNLLSVLGKAFYRIRIFIVYLQLVS